ncbi:septation protein IspZ [Vibrio sp. TRT 21S02]|uniref:septation protein IspZ n=1 Tax=Vibrio sp. TRT 21S02 TaxID=3418507 RepID=UPI003CF27F41
MRQLLTALSAIVLLAYPFAVYFGIDKFGLTVIGGLLVAVFLLRIVSASQAKLRELKQLAWISGVTGLVLTALGIWFKQHGWLTFYPVVVNVCMFTVFAHSLQQPQTIIERLARLQEPDLPESGVRYTRNVTLVWCGFFVFNGAIAFYTCFQSIKVWTLYNGLISYLLAGGLFALEWIVRQFVRKDT